MHVDQKDAHPWLTPEKQFIRERWSAARPCSACASASQLLAEAAGARPYRSPSPRSAGARSRSPSAGAADPVIGPLAPSVELFEWHHYEAPLPPGAVELARTPACVQAFRLEGKPAWGLQFHAEVTREDLSGWLDGWDEPEARRHGLRPGAPSAPRANCALRHRTRSGANSRRASSPKPPGTTAAGDLRRLGLRRHDRREAPDPGLGAASVRRRRSGRAAAGRRSGARAPRASAPGRRPARPSARSGRPRPCPAPARP